MDFAGFPRRGSAAGPARKFALSPGMRAASSLFRAPPAHIPLLQMTASPEALLPAAHPIRLGTLCGQLPAWPMAAAPAEPGAAARPCHGGPHGGPAGSARRPAAPLRPGLREDVRPPGGWVVMVVVVMGGWCGWVGGCGVGVGGWGAHHEPGVLPLGPAVLSRLAAVAGAPSALLPAVGSPGWAAAAAQRASALAPAPFSALCAAPGHRQAEVTAPLAPQPTGPC